MIFACLLSYFNEINYSYKIDLTIWIEPKKGWSTERRTWNRGKTWHPTFRLHWATRSWWKLSTFSSNSGRLLMRHSSRRGFSVKGLALWRVRVWRRTYRTHCRNSSDSNWSGLKLRITPISYNKCKNIKRHWRPSNSAKMTLCEIGCWRSSCASAWKATRKRPS